MKKAFNFKITAFLGMLLCLFLCLTPTAHAEVTTTKPNWDTSIYNTSWTKANVKYWTTHGNFFFGRLQKTNAYIRITNQKDELIKNVTRLETSYIIDNKQYWVNKDLVNNTSHFFSSFGNAVSKEGEFFICTESKNKSMLGKKFYDSEGKISEYQECNYRWSWNYKVEKIVYLYVWYLDPITGKEVAGSFFENGEHPIYDENGILKGIYDVDGNLIDDLNIGADGIIEDETGNDILSWEDQFEGNINQKLSFFEWGFGETATYITRFLSIAFILVCSAIIVIVLRFLWRKLS